MNTLANCLEWILNHISFKSIILTVVALYFIACTIDLIAPIDTSRGSWWNIFYQVLDWIS